MAYIGQTGCSNKVGMTDSSVLNKSAIAEHVSILARKHSHINYILWDMIVIELCYDKMFTT